MTENAQKVLLTGGAGYVGAALVPKLLAAGHHVRILDLFWYGEEVLASVADHPALEVINGDIREASVVKKAVAGCNAVIHLACVSNDPSFELDPGLGRAINYDAFMPFLQLSRAAGVRRFIYASSSSVYGIKSEPEVTENLPLEPLTDYSKYKAMCESLLLAERTDNFAVMVLRPATVCGYSPRMRLDLTVNILTSHAFHNRRIEVFGGDQMRPNIHIDDITDLYVQTLAWTDEQINGKIYNAGYENLSVAEIARIVRTIVGEDVELVTVPTDDTRSYHISSERIRDELDFHPKRTVRDAIHDLLSAFRLGRIPDAIHGSRYYNIRRMTELLSEV